MAPSKEQLKKCVVDNLDNAVARLNAALAGDDVSQYERVLKRIGRGGRLPHWYEHLRDTGTLPNLDGKTVGSVLEMLFVAVVEQHILTKKYAIQLRINPASGVDLPDLDLGVKTPSENYCTSEPLFSAYERLLGIDCDVLALLTNYQTTKRHPPLRIQIIDCRYLTCTQMADAGLCKLALLHRSRLLEDSESHAKKIFRFLAHVNQSDWRARKLIQFVEKLYDDDAIRAILVKASKDFEVANARLIAKGALPMSGEELDAILAIGQISPLHVGVIDAVDNWVIETHREFGRHPNENEWNRLKTGPLDGKIGVSFAMQWRFNFSHVFHGSGRRDSTGSLK